LRGGFPPEISRTRRFIDARIKTGKLRYLECCVVAACACSGICSQQSRRRGTECVLSPYLTELTSSCHSSQMKGQDSCTTEKIYHFLLLLSTSCGLDLSGSVSRVSQRNLSKKYGENFRSCSSIHLSLCEEEHDSNSMEQVEERRVEKRTS